MRNGNWLRLGAALAIAKLAVAGGFWISLGNPEASSDPKAKGAVMTVRPDGCHEPAKAKVTATAEGLVDGQRRTVKLTPVALATPGMYAIQREWPAGGVWVVSVVAVDGGRTTSAVAVVDAKGMHREGAAFYPRPPQEREIAALLRKR